VRYYHNSTFLPQKQRLPSVIDNGASLRDTFMRMVEYYDPNKSRNKKTAVLDATSVYIWDEYKMNLFNVTKTNNMRGSVRKHRYDIIMYEPPRNNQCYAATAENSRLFRSLLAKGGTLIIRASDFKTKGDTRLRGTFDIKSATERAGFVLVDQIIYRHRDTIKISNPEPEETCSIVHSSFLIFKPSGTKPKR